MVSVEHEYDVCKIVRAVIFLELDSRISLVRLVWSCLFSFLEASRGDGRLFWPSERFRSCDYFLKSEIWMA